MSLLEPKVEPEIVTQIVYSVPEVYFPTIPDFMLFYNTVEVDDLVKIESVTILWDEWLEIEKYMMLNEVAIESLYNK